MTVTQTASTPSSVTITVEGMANSSSRQTYVWITAAIDGEETWMTLGVAEQNGYITIDTDVTSNNGDITIIIPTAYRDYKVWQFDVRELIDGDETTYNYVIISTVLGFEYDGENTKIAGESIDITVDDMKQINLSGGYIDAWINEGDGAYFDLYGVSKGDDIYADYLTEPASQIYNAAYKYRASIPMYSLILSSCEYIVDNCTSGALVEAQFFNDIKWAINNFMMSF